jgi:prolyl-tRNA synthetase
MLSIRLSPHGIYMTVFVRCIFMISHFGPRCEEVACEESLKLKSQAESKGVEDAKQTGAAKSLCIPFEQDPIPSGAVCFCCGKAAKRWALFGRSY